MYTQGRDTHIHQTEAGYGFFAFWPVTRAHSTCGTSRIHKEPAFHFKGFEPMCASPQQDIYVHLAGRDQEGIGIARRNDGMAMSKANAEATTTQRLSLISRHLDQRLPLPELNTPFSTERHSLQPDDLEYKPLDRTSLPSTPQTQSTSSAARMSSQAPHSTLLIPGPIEFDDAVLQSMSHYAESHVSPAFVKVFGETLTLVRKLFQSTNPSAQPFVISGSGTLGWDVVASNLIEKGENALVLHTGYFADSFAACLETYGAHATQLKAPIGDRPSFEQIEQSLKEKPYKIITITHVDTSTGVLSDIKRVTEIVRRVSPDTLVVVDGVCSVGCEEIAFDDWDLDVVLTASQKAIGCPPGLSILMLSGRAIDRFKSRKTPPSSYFASIANWMPIMQNYENNKPSYFATPPLSLFTLCTLLYRVKAAIAELGLRQLASQPESQAHAMTAIYLPDGLTPADVLPGLLKRGVIFAAGLHKEVATRYIRFGHMGVSVTDPARNDIDKAIAALKEALTEAKQAKGL
ncbi:alanine--glyoxylate transaminase [Aspergillus novofumigatus IBT 16806]|uniref:alanine--glyoxylate transaminase n=1 Tax=Aspergillus novofumigatus (strain IBT 16806) TaxID=1392255 RepID=A0A2I1CA08_ASPN1|nr:PLP-dependent transferase [Aspergillus novofumigatus IBT 16806]PKX94421.1 PLP-dependent transferase [Aspergillus novofumigatus IBT 16806]